MSGFTLLCLAATLLLAYAEPMGTSVSGISSGAYMAIQYEFAYSSEVIGAGLFAGGPYYCAKGSILDALNACMSSPSLISVPTLDTLTQGFASSGKIDPLENLKSHKVYIFSGKKDATVVPGVTEAAKTMYENLGVTNINANFGSDAGHSFPTTEWGNACGTTQSPYITNCNYDGAGAALQTIYGELAQPVPPKAENLKTIDIAQFVPSGDSPSSLSMDDRMYYYEASYCNGNCTVHVAFHGCQMTFADIGTAFVEHAGYNKWAEANHMVILYPFTIRKYFAPSNPNGCWDWWGYDSADYSFKSGPQMQTVHNMIRYFKERH